MKQSDPLLSMGVVLMLLAIAYAVWIFGLGDWLVARQCGVRPSSINVQSVLQYVDCRDSVGRSAGSFGWTVAGVIGAILVYVRRGREKAADARLNAQLDADMRDIRKRQP